MSKKKMDSKSFAQRKRGRRQLLTTVRIFRYGTDSFVRNSWLSVAATAVMTITLLIIFITVAAQNVLTNTVGDLRNKVDMSIYLKTETTDADAAKIMVELKNLSSVRSVTYLSAEQVRNQIAQENSGDADVLAAIKEATNKNPGTLRVVIQDINDTSELEKFVKDDTLLKENISTDSKPSFAGERRDTIKTIGRAVGFIQQVGITVGAVFVAISALIIFNTIRMAIFNRKEEIQMMQLIGADKSFIRGPFLVESFIYGFIAAIIATGLGLWGLFASAKTLLSYVSIQPTIDLAMKYGVLVFLAMIGVGVFIGIVSSLLATHKYLKL